MKEEGFEGILMKKLIRKMLYVTMLMCVSFLAYGCAGNEEEEVVVSSEEAVVELCTETDYRTAIAELGTEETDLLLAVEYYDKLWLMDAFTEADFDALIQVYETLGDAEKLRETMIRRHTYYPSEANVAAISNVTVYRDKDDEGVTDMMNTFISTLSADDKTGIKAMILSEAWGEEMQDALVGVCRKTLYSGNGYVAQITSDTYSTEISVLREDSSFVYYKVDASGEILAEAFWKDGNYAEGYTISYYTPEGELLKECSGTFDNGITVGDFTMKYDGGTYTGEFDEKGNTTVEQKDKISNNGGVVYAYNKSKQKYLYAEDTDMEAFIIDHAYLGLPAYVEWN